MELLYKLIGDQEQPKSCEEGAVCPALLGCIYGRQVFVDTPVYRPQPKLRPYHLFIDT